MSIIYTIGHSNVPFETFLQKLDNHGIKLLTDVRSHPGSKTVPWTARENLERVLKDRYLWLPDLGGPEYGLIFPKGHIGLTRPEFKKVPKEQRCNSWWNVGLYEYGLWMGNDPKFLKGIEKLLELSEKYGGMVAIMCAEILYWRCHRSMISDYLYAHGHEVRHIMTEKKWTLHPISNRLERYEPETQKKLWPHKEPKQVSIGY